MRRVKVTLYNTFHHTAVRVMVPLTAAGEPWQYVQAMASCGFTGPRRQLRRIERTLCGYQGCTCGTVRPATWPR